MYTKRTHIRFIVAKGGWTFSHAERAHWFSGYLQ